jgi:hypothetical protein
MKDKLELMKNYQYEDIRELYQFRWEEEEFEEFRKSKKASEDRLKIEYVDLKEYEKLTVDALKNAIRAWQLKKDAVALDSESKFKVNAAEKEFDDFLGKCNDAREELNASIQSHINIIEACDEGISALEEWNNFLEHWIEKEISNET